MRHHNFLRLHNLRAVRLDGHDYYLSYIEVLVIAEFLEANVIVVQRPIHGNSFEVLGRTSHAGHCAIVALTNTGRGAVRGHLEGLMEANVYHKGLELEAAARRKRAAEATEAEQKRRRMEEEQKNAGTKHCAPNTLKKQNANTAEKQTHESSMSRIR